MSGCGCGAANCECDTSTVITVADLALLKSNLETVESVVESPALFTTTPSGRQIDTLTGALTKLGYMPPIAYAGGIAFLATEGTKTVERDGVVYAPLPSALPFTTTGTWTAGDDAKFFAIQSVMLYGGDVTIVKATVADMQADASLQLGNIIHTAGYLAVGDLGAARYRVVAAATGPADGGTYINLTASGLQAEAVSDSDRINVAQYGAVGNGTVNDTAAIQAAINAVSAYGGGELEFPLTGGGTYKCNVVLKPGVSLRGASRDVTLIPATNSPVITLQVDADVERCAIRELTIDGTATQGSFTAQDGIRMAPDIGNFHTSVQIVDCLIKNCGSDGVVLYGAAGAAVVEHVGLVQLIRTTITNCTGAGLRMTGNVVLCEANACDIRDNGDEATDGDSNIVLEADTVPPSRNSLVGCRIETGSYVAEGAAVALLSALDTSIERCQFGEFHTAVLIGGTPNGVITMRGNRFERGSGPIDAIVEFAGTVNGFIYDGNNVNAGTTGPVGLDLPADAANAQRVSIGSQNSWGGLTASTSGLPVTIISAADTVLELPNNAGAVPVNLTAAGTAAVNTIEDFNSGTAQLVHGDTIQLNITTAGRNLQAVHGTGNLLLAGGANFTLNEPGDRLVLVWDGYLAKWVELSRMSVS